jgi:hypothetical protein
MEDYMLFKVKDVEDDVGSAKFRKACQFALKGIEAARASFMSQTLPASFDDVDRSELFGGVLYAAHIMSRDGCSPGRSASDLLDRIGPQDRIEIPTGSFIGTMIANRAAHWEEETRREVLSALALLPGFDFESAERGDAQSELGLEALEAVHPTLRALAFEIAKPLGTQKYVGPEEADSITRIWEDFEAMTFRDIDMRRLEDAMMEAYCRSRSEPAIAEP